MLTALLKRLVAAIGAWVTVAEAQDRLRRRRKAYAQAVVPYRAPRYDLTGLVVVGIVCVTAYEVWASPTTRQLIQGITAAHAVSQSQSTEEAAMGEETVPELVARARAALSSGALSEQDATWVRGAVREIAPDEENHPARATVERLRILLNKRGL